MNACASSAYRRRLAALIVLLVIAADQATKWLILNRSGLTPQTHIAVLPFFNLVLWSNHGVSFGLFNRNSAPGLQRLILALLTLAIVSGLLQWLRQAARIVLAIGISLVVGGAIGNLIDRFLHGAVVDFLYFAWHGYDFPAFNVADSCITIGVGLILLDGVLNRNAGEDGSVPFTDRAKGKQ